MLQAEQPCTAEDIPFSAADKQNFNAHSSTHACKLPRQVTLMVKFRLGLPYCCSYSGRALFVGR